MKLYTKEMFLIAAEKCEVSMIDAEHIMKYIDEYVTPIELPSNEEIEKAALEFFADYEKVGVSQWEISAFIMGMKEYREQLKSRQ